MGNRRGEITRKYSEGGGDGFRLRLIGNSRTWQGFNGHNWTVFTHRFNVVGDPKPSYDVYVSGFHVLWTEDFEDIDRIIETFGGGKPLLDDTNAEWVKYD